MRKKENCFVGFALVSVICSNFKGEKTCSKIMQNASPIKCVHSLFEYNELNS